MEDKMKCPYLERCEHYKTEGIKCRDLYYLCEYKFKFDESDEPISTLDVMLQNGKWGDNE